VEKSAYDKALDEYNVICEYHRSHDQLKWQVLALMYGGAAVLAASAAAGRYSYFSLFIAAASAALITMGTAIYGGIHQYLLWRLERAWELEGTLDFHHHTAIRDRSQKPGGKQHINDWVRFGYWVPWALWACFVGLTLWKRL
jgi:cystathionine beta-lyase/cystathionine gamma-synthase